VSIGVIWVASASGQAPEQTARIETLPLQLTMPDSYHVAVALEPIRRLLVLAPADGVIRSVDVKQGSTVREGQELAQLDRSEALAKQKVAKAEVREKQAVVKANGISTMAEILQAQLDAALAREELASLELDRFTVRAPFASRVLELPVSVGQYVLKGTPIAEVVDTSSLRALVPIDRRKVTPGSGINVPVEDQEVAGKVQAVLPLPESYAMLRQLATPFGAAVVIFPNLKGDLEPGLRARPAGVPTAAITTVPKRAVRADDVRGVAGSMIQVIRNEYVTNVPVQVLGTLGPDRVQVSGNLRDADALVVGSSVALNPGTLVRFGSGGPGREVEGTSPNPAVGGVEAGIFSPAGGNPPNSAGRPGGARTTGSTGKRTVPGSRSGNPPAQSASGGSTPF
jgi:RND family efflux transporter MFP subunit